MLTKLLPVSIMQFCSLMNKNEEGLIDMRQIIFATGNKGKMREIRKILAGLIIEGEETQILSMKEAGLDPEIVEDGKSFEENAIIKAKTVAAFAKDAIVLADDSGLEVDYLNGEPGIYSARYLGEDTPYSVKNAHIIELLTGVEGDERSARFVCAIAAVLPGGEVLCEKATIEGVIGYEEKGSNGFGYDPIFYVPSYAKTTAELSEEEKNEISHRGKALRAIRVRLETEA